jgi:hypothetical protein
LRRAIAYFVAAALIVAVVVLPSTVQLVLQGTGAPPLVVEKSKEGKGKKAKEVTTVTPTGGGRVLAASDVTLLALGSGALLIGCGILVHRIIRTGRS